MIWRAVKFITLSEVIGWVAFLAVSIVLGSLGVRSGKVTDAVMMVLWFVLFFAAYQFLHRRRAR